MVRSKKVLITGSEGFTGSYMKAEMEAAGYQVFSMGAQPASIPNYCRANLLDKDAINTVVAAVRPDIVFHLAAVTFVAADDANSMYNVNVLGTRNLLAALAGAPQRPERVLLASSANVYGTPDTSVLTETTPPAPASDYAVSKLAMEYMASLWMDRLPVTITRPFNYTGVGQDAKFLIPKIVAHFKCGADFIELGNLDIWRDFSDVRSVVQSYRKLVEADAVGEVVNICSSKEYSLRDVIDMCSKITGHHLRIEVNPKFVRKKEVPRLLGDASRLRRLIGDWESLPLETTLRWMLGTQ
ncbi:GDP-mannose 4,6 dehydratase [Rhizobium sp. Root274]|uniref:GDP-mannose 4,6-dehydratase n=1 Tax=unclassified Rhizobium TaxID=2613769 RepID=UPI00071239B0|nr:MULTISPECIES: GDP-mannose 4,6-dehydratase [unclassified Rhizobium]KQW31333.1 GDP-mannose 4,6 dehydratase [Rhizobium sp. Root1240]KRD32877.1 GDP-mannose 4,6 dehydratase [Rhizobium sp. Root274]